MNTTEIKLTVDGIEYPLNFSKVTGPQVLRLRRELGLEPMDLVNAVITSTSTLPELVAIQALSLQQRDQPADYDHLLAHITLSSDIELTIDDFLGTDSTGGRPKTKKSKAKRTS